MCKKYFTKLSFYINFKKIKKIKNHIAIDSDIFDMKLYNY
jgi:hypothetical protein